MVFLKEEKGWKQTRKRTWIKLVCACCAFNNEGGSIQISLILAVLQIDKTI